RRLPAQPFSSGRLDRAEPGILQLLEPVRAGAAVFETCSGSPPADQERTQNIFCARLAERVYWRPAIRCRTSTGPRISEYRSAGQRPSAQDSGSLARAGSHGENPRALPVTALSPDARGSAEAREGTEQRRRKK